MNRRSLFGKLIGAVVGIKVAPVIALDPAFKVGGSMPHVSHLDLLFINEKATLVRSYLAEQAMRPSAFYAKVAEQHFPNLS